MNFKLRAETHYSQPKKVRNTKCPYPLLIISAPASFQTLPFPIDKIEAAWVGLDVAARKKKQKSLCCWCQV